MHSRNESRHSQALVDCWIEMNNNAESQRSAVTLFFEILIFSVAVVDVFVSQINYLL